MTGYYMSQP